MVWLVEKTACRDGSKFMGNPGRDNRQGGKHFFGRKKKGAGTFFAIKKGGKYFFLEKIKGTNIIFHRKKGGHEIFSSHRINILINRIILLLKIEVFVP